MRSPKLKFLCYAQDRGVIPPPYPARKFVPEWFKDLKPKVGGDNKLENSTIKRCPPFLDALTAGWIIPLAADVEFVTNGDASGVTYKWHYYRPMVENHTAAQVEGHESLPKPPMKFLNYWAIKAPPGYSVLFVPPLNRPDPRFQCLSGLVDCDRYLEFVNFPFFFHEANFTGVIKQGTPLVQAIPIRRDALLKGYTADVFCARELQDLELTRRKRQAHESHYRDHCWVHK